ncbi:hypothetical protein DL96DRAFT_1459368, partial [Flagelloscypha sp. PMI_526]
DARVFKVYNEVAEEYDRDMIRGFRDTLDSLLIFASLFSAVITTFVVQTAQALPTDQAVITNHLLVDIATLLRANGNATILATIPPSNFGPDTSTFKTADIWINGLFFASLSLSLATALLSVLAKQWLQVRHPSYPITFFCSTRPGIHSCDLWPRKRDCAYSTPPFSWTGKMENARDYWCSAAHPTCFTGSLLRWPVRVRPNTLRGDCLCRCYYRRPSLFVLYRINHSPRH